MTGPATASSPRGKADPKKDLDCYRARRGRFRIVDIPDMAYLMIDGHGDPNTTQVFAEAIETMYPVAYACKFGSKRRLGRDYVVPPLEGLWWAEDMTSFTRARDKSRWSWTLMIMVPDWVTADLIDDAIAAVRAKGAAPRIADLRVESMSEGRCVQTLHVGSFDDEGSVLAEMHDSFIPDNGLTMTGRHHEIYLSDFRKTPEDRRKTILRQPVTGRS
ncbi:MULTISPECIES: GyrI-like domain-containing protein [unclassified Gordonia (in: high G+C Gram-positive bacteria)]